jgi:hypothetical protein
MPGLPHSEQHQTYGINGKLIFNLPGNYVGRNVPDISFMPIRRPDIRPITRRIPSDLGFLSLVAVQALNGVTALLDQSVNGRIGLLNYPLYDLAHASKGHKGSQPSLRDISSGDNWFYYGRNAYSQGAGLGTLDVGNFAAYLRGLNP